jgi:hypothetical protein
MPSSRIIDLVIGLAFVFSVTAALASVLTELVARVLGLRGAALLSAVRDLVDADSRTATTLSQVDDDYARLKTYVNRPRGRTDHGTTSTPATATGSTTDHDTAGAILGSPILSNQGMTNRISSRTGLELTADGGDPSRSTSGSTLVSKDDRLRRHTRSLPAYIPARSFAQAVLDIVIPDDAQHATIDDVRTGVQALPDSTLKSSLLAVLKSADTDIDTFRTAVEHWYDDHMSRVSGWYKRRISKITLVVGALLVILLNVNALTIAKTLYTDNDVRGTLAAVAGRAASCPADANQQTCLNTLNGQLADATSAGLPVGWGTVADCTSAATRCNWWDERGLTDPHGGSAGRLVLVLLGFALTITALVPGARFWFDLLSRLGSLRSSGPRPATSS